MMVYFIEVFICWFIFLSVYFLALRKETFFEINRWYLLLSLITGIIIPLIEIESSFLRTSETTIQNLSTLFATNPTVSVMVDTSESCFVFSWPVFLFILYLIGLILFSARFFYGLNKIYGLYKTRIVKEYLNHFQIIRTSGVHTPFSFFNLVFISHQCSFEQDLQKVLKHEWFHIKGWHSMDILFMELMQVIFWVNPMIYFYKKAIKQNHEFIADAAVIREVPFKEYGRVLLSQQARHFQLVLANHFYQSQLKSRIMKMKQQPSKRKALLKYALIIPLLGFMLTMFSFVNPAQDLIMNSDQFTAQDTLKPPPPPPDVKAPNLKEPPPPPPADRPGIVPNPPEAPLPPHAQDLADLKESKLSLTTDINQHDLMFKEVEEMPRFPGCEKISDSNERSKCAHSKLIEFISANLKYPAEAKKAAQEGMAVIKFIVDEKGRVENIELVKDPGYGMGKAAIAAMQAMNQQNIKWIPGKLQGKTAKIEMTLPVNFRLPKNEK